MVLVLLPMFTILYPLIRTSGASSSSSFVEEDEPFKPTMPTRPLPDDANNNSIADALDMEIAYKIAIGKGGESISVTVMLGSEPADNDLQAFTSAGGNVTHGPWTMATYGFGGTIRYDKIGIFVQNCPKTLYIEKEATFTIEPPLHIRIRVFVGDMSEVIRVAALFGAKCPNPLYDSYWDLNDDGIIDIKDVAIVARHFNPCSE
jgi:hypothetical protein